MHTSLLCVGLLITTCSPTEYAIPKAPASLARIKHSYISIYDNLLDSQLDYTALIKIITIVTTANKLLGYLYMRDLPGQSYAETRL